MRLFDVLGPVMTGPSSSHTAGAVRIGLTARNLLGEAPKTAEILLHGSFAATGRGHGTDRALVAGLLGLSPADVRVPDSFRLARERGLDFRFTPCTAETEVHPNTVDIRMVNAAGQEMTVRGESLGGGKVRIARINGVEVDFTAAAPVLTGQVSLSLKLYQLLWLGLHFGLRALSTYVNHRNRHKQQREAV